ncbi:MAG: bifunctional UDP-N-acetylglucosamine diphosphorylase/glucosamine-1-phosphate N-acetyltransferase GlmU [Gammaproteobacteria bacterium]|nr:bifunctional UDP-N-acetylglucosamine diphosphorylase/glucosamine-1-phosphate N-acetyltransferase GlmU [Gammaproteobacteria bacterium]MDH5628941.1 bifunctional UDP-N-acetylglucosamine diphosphorylase/glucosamine-1-phosphate N-acetyltransferase GlmU [Gammaproteobacteria bacterium]
MNIEVIILAAGKGSRMKSDLPKVLHELSGKSLAQHVVDTCQTLGAKNSHIIVGHGAEQVKQTLTSNKMNLNFIHQKEQLGTGHAVKMANDDLADDCTTLILYGDVPLIHHDTLSQLVEFQQENRNGITMISCLLENPTGYGRIIRNKNNEVIGIVEQKDATEEQLKINEINTGILCCNSTNLKKWVNQLNNNNAQGEYYLTDIIAMAKSEGGSVIAVQPENLYEVEGINTLSQLAKLERIWQLSLAEELMANGVIIKDPARFDLRGYITCENDVVIDINCIIEGTVIIKRGAKIGPNVFLKNCKIGENTEIKANSVIEDAEVKNDCKVGPFARLRPGAILEDEAQVGNFVEIKKSILGKGSKASHLAYLGDSEIGSNVNVGAGVITCNYDGANKYKTIIEDGAFIGSDSQLVAPVTIGKNVTVAAGTTVTKDVADGMLCISRSKQKEIAGWKRPVKNKKAE